MYWWRVTKYNPSYRHADGYYTKEEWTDFSEIGKRFSDGVFTLKKYQKIESAYIDAIISFMDCLKIKYLIINQVEKSRSLKKLSLSPQQIALYKKKNGDLVLRGEITGYVQLILRNYLWCKLKYPRRMQVHFGWDYYMYIGASKLCSDILTAIEENGLFIEPFLSPYL